MYVCVGFSPLYFFYNNNNNNNNILFRHSSFLYEGKGTKRNEKEETNGYGHTKRKAPLLARSVKLSLFGLG